MAYNPLDGTPILALTRAAASPGQVLAVAVPSGTTAPGTNLGLPVDSLLNLLNLTEAAFVAAYAGKTLTAYAGQWLMLTARAGGVGNVAVAVLAGGAVATEDAYLFDPANPANPGTPVAVVVGASAVTTGPRASTTPAATATATGTVKLFAALGAATDGAADQNTVTTALAAKADLIGGKVPVSQLPGYVHGVQEYDTIALLPATGALDVLYIVTTGLDANKEFRWSGTQYVEIAKGASNTDALAEGTTNKYFTNARAIGALLTGYVTATAARAIAATDSILVAIGLLDATQQQHTQQIAANAAGRYQGPWAATTAYAAKDVVSNPAGTLVQALVAFTSAAAYSAADWGVFVPLATGALPGLVQVGQGLRSNGAVLKTTAVDYVSETYFVFNGTQGLIAGGGGAWAISGGPDVTLAASTNSLSFGLICALRNIGTTTAPVQTNITGSTFSDTIQPGEFVWYKQKDASTFEVVLRGRTDGATAPPVALTPTTGAVALNFAATPRHTLAATGNVSFTTTNRAVGGAEKTVRIHNTTAAAITLAYEAWTTYGAALPTSLAAGKYLILTLICYNTTIADVDAAAVLSN
jgi:hypothetical protein